MHCCDYEGCGKPAIDQNQQTLSTRIIAGDGRESHQCTVPVLFDIDTAGFHVCKRHWLHLVRGALERPGAWRAPDQRRTSLPFIVMTDPDGPDPPNRPLHLVCHYVDEPHGDVDADGTITLKRRLRFLDWSYDEDKAWRFPTRWMAHSAAFRMGIMVHDEDEERYTIKEVSDDA